MGEYMEQENSNIIGKKVNHATKWSFLTEILAKIIVPLTTSILAHILVPEAFGVIATINMVITFTDVLTESGFGQYLIQHDFEDEKEYRHSIDVAFWSNFGISVLIWVIILLLRSPISSLVGNDGYEIPLVVACLSIPITSFSAIPIAILQKKLDYKSLFFNRIAGSLTPLLVSTPLALLGFDYWSLIVGTLCSHVVKATVLIVRSKWHPHFCFSFVLLKKMLSYSIWILLEAIAMWACTWIDIFIVSRTFGNYYNGLYKTAQTTVTGILSVVTASVNSIVFVALSKLKNNMEEFRNMFYSSQKKLAVLVVPMGVGVLVYSKMITRILLGSKWDEAAAFLGMWGLCMALVATMGTFCREALRAKGLPKVSLIVQTLHLIFIVPVIWIAKDFGYNKLIYCRSIAYLQVIVLLHIFAKKHLDISPKKICSNTIWPAVCSVVMGSVGLCFNYFFSGRLVILSLSILVCIFVYFSLLVIRPEYKNLVKQLIKNSKVHKNE